MQTETPAPLPVATAIETLVSELEREQAWLTDLRADAQRAERDCQRLLTAIESAIGMLPPGHARPFMIRVLRMRAEVTRMGRPPRDGRQLAVIDLLATRGEGPIRSAEIRAHLEQHGLKGSTYYVGGVMSALHRPRRSGRLARDAAVFSRTHESGPSEGCRRG